jgi:hypothetical protein
MSTRKAKHDISAIGKIPPSHMYIESRKIVTTLDDTFFVIPIIIVRQCP